MVAMRVPQSNNDGVYFLTFTVYRWYYLFDRFGRWEILANSLKYFRQNKELKIYSFVFMLNHLHLIIHSKDVAGFIRDFKKFTSKEIKKNILLYEPHLLKLFINNGKNYQFWQKSNMPIEMDSQEIFNQKDNYISNNPVKKEYVMAPEDWYWSSANKFCEIQPDEFEC